MDARLRPRRKPDAFAAGTSGTGCAQRSNYERGAAPARRLFSLQLSLWACKEKVDSKTQKSLNASDARHAERLDADKNFSRAKPNHQNFIEVC